MPDLPRFPAVAGVEIIDVIGRGGFATVYSGYQAAFHRHVAVKVLQRSELDADARRRFDRECQVMGSLSNHPYIVTLFVAGYTENERPYIVMPYVRDGTLDDRIRNAGPVPWQEVVQTGVRLAGALETAHRAGVLHRDVKPANVLRAEYGDVLGDFGIARIAGGHETQSGVITASIAHAPPEVLEGEAPSAQADVYSLGSTLFEAIAGRAAFGPTSESAGYASMIRRILLDPPPALSSGQAPPQVADVVRRALSKDKADRHGSAREFGEDLRAAQQALSQVPTDMLVLGITTEPVARADPNDDTGDRTVVVVEPPPLERGPAEEDDLDESGDEGAETLPHVALAPRANDSLDEPERSSRRWVLAGAIGLVGVLALAGLIVASRGGDDSVTSPSHATTDATNVTNATSASSTTNAPTTINPQTTAPLNPTSPPDPTPLVLAPGDPVRIEMLNPGIQSEVLDELVQDFEAENTDISVDIVERIGYRNALESLLNGDVAPDVALLADRAVQSVLDQVEFVPVQEFIARDGVDDRSLLANADMYATADGLAAMPFNVAVPMVYANRDLLERAGVELAPGASLTTDGLLDRCELLADVVPTCFEFGTSAFLFTELITNSGGRVFDTDGFEGSARTVGFDTPVGRASFRFLVDPVIDGTARVRTAERLFESGGAAFFINTSSVLGSVDRALDEAGGEVELSAVGLPHIDGVEPSGIVPGGGALWILDRGDDRRAIAAWLLVGYLSELEQLNPFHQASGYVPPRSDAGDDAGFLAFWSTKPVYRGAYDELVESAAQSLPNERDGRAGPFHQVDEAILDRLAQAQTGELTTDEAFDALVDDVNTLLAEYAATNG